MTWSSRPARWPLLCGILLLAGAAWGGRRGMQPQQSPDATCSVRVASTPLVLGDGSPISIDPSALIVDSAEVLVLGTPTIVWRPGMGRTSVPRTDIRAIGAIVGPTGEVHFVPSPPGIDDAQFPRAAPAGQGRYHILFVTGQLGSPSSPIAFDTATIWYGLLDGGRWTGLTRVAFARSAYLVPRMASRVTLVAGEPALAYAFDHSFEQQSNARGSRGLVLVTRRGGRWRQDSLLTPDGPRSVEFMSDRDAGGLTAWFVQREFREGRLQPASLYSADHRGAWGAPVLRYTPTSGHVNTPGIVEAPSLRVVAWRIESETPDSSDRVEWAYDQSRERQLAPLTLGRAIQPLESIAFAAVDSERIAFVLRDEARQGKVGVALASPGGIERHWTDVIADNPAIVAAYGGRRSMLVLTTRLGSTDGEPRVQSTLSRLHVTCPGTR